jgi:hypothetical protein
LAGILRYESARPLNIIMANDLGGFLYNGQKRPDRVAGAEGRIDSSNFDPNRDRLLTPSGWVDPGPLKFGNAPKNDGTVRGFANYGEDLSAFKNFIIKEQMRVRFEAQFGNIFNRTVFCDPDTNFSAGSFGQVSSQCNQPRSIQFGLRLDY